MKSANIAHWICSRGKFRFVVFASLLFPLPRRKPSDAVIQSPFVCLCSDVPRMKKSICNLIAAPQNNFRVFHNGRGVYADKRDERAFESFLSSFFGNKS